VTPSCVAAFRSTSDALDDPDELVDLVAVLAREADELARSGRDRAALGAAGNRDPAAAPELEQAFVTQNAQRAERGVCVDAEDGREVARGR